jgi:hypothetical protein
MDPAPPEPPQSSTPPVVQASPAPAPVQMTVQEPDADRPQGISLALGVGYAMQVMTLETPNIASIRLRLPSGLTFEPTVQLSSSSHTDDDSVDETTDKLTVLGVSTLVRLPLMKRGKYDLEGLGSATFVTSKNNPDGDYNNTTSTAVQLGYGVAITWWPSPHWNFSMSLVNPLIDYRTSKQGTGVPDSSQKTTDTTIGVILDTDVFFMLHLYN